MKYSGVATIARLNWPWYAAGAITTAVGLTMLDAVGLHEHWRAAALIALVLGGVWMLLSLLVSHYVYDRSAIARGEWLDGIATSNVRRAAIYHAGQDEASAVAARLLGRAEIVRFDFYDSDRNGTPSLERARARNILDAVSIAPESIPLEDGSVDLSLTVFAAHEIREHHERVAFLRELARTMRADGRLVVVEHLRDLPNLIAYGPGFFHFLSRRTWKRSFADAALTIASERSCTPFVRVFELTVQR